MLAEMCESIASSFKTMRQPKPPKPTLPLLAALEHLEIEPFSKSKVDEYKYNLLHQTMQMVREKRLDEGWQDFTNARRTISFPADPAGLILQTREYCEQDAYPLRAILEPSWFEGPFLFCYLGRAGATPFVFALKWFREKRSAFELPDFVRHKTAQISAIEPGVTFETDTLRSTTEAYDPFLIVKLGEEEYYIEVWGDDDHKFPR